MAKFKPCNEDQLVMLPPETIKAEFKLPIDVARALSSLKTSSPPPTPTKHNKRPFSAEDADLLIPQDSRYPQALIQCLGAKAPEKLWVWGNLDLLNRPAIGFCGSRDVSEKGLAVTTDVSEQVAQLGWVTVSGHARGVDSAAHRTALEHGAGTILVLPEGMHQFKLRQELRALVHSENTLIVSEFDPDARWAVGRAMQRNQTIIGLSRVMILIEARMEGGTFAAGKTAIALHHPIFVVNFQERAETNAGNQYFLQHGAYTLWKNELTQRANIAPIVELVRSAKSPVLVETPQQLQLDGL
jgi:DNA processing protein